MRVVDAIAQWFEVAGFRHYFGCRGAVWPFLDALTDKPGIEASRPSTSPTPCIWPTSTASAIVSRRSSVEGPGLLNAVGPAPAPCTSPPVLTIAGGSTTHFLGKAGMQEIHYHGFEDAQSIFRPVCKCT